MSKIFVFFTDYSPSEAALRCKNGAMYHGSDRCLYDVDEFRIQTACRDATHLENCGMHLINKFNLFLSFTP